MENQTQKLASAFLLASMFLNFLTPQALGVSLNMPSDVHSPQIFSREDVNFESVFGNPDIFDEVFLDHNQPLTIGETSFLAIKVPPIQKQVIVSRMWLFMTAYSSTEDQTDSTPFITAANTPVRDGVVAANFLPFGTKIRMPTLYGDKTFIVEDRMNERYPYRLDVWMESRAEALQFGLQVAPIEVIREI